MHDTRPSSTFQASTDSPSASPRSSLPLVVAGGILFLCTCGFILFVYGSIVAASYTVARNATNDAASTAQAQRAATATPLAQRTATAQAVQVALTRGAGWPVVFSDSFDQDAGHWALTKWSDQYGTLEREISGGTLHWTANSVRGVVWRFVPGSSSVTDFFLNVDARQTSGQGETEYGVVFRYDRAGNFYLFEIGEEQYLRLLLWSERKWTTLIDWTKSNAIRRGEMNHLSVSAEGAHFILVINGQFASEASDSTLSSGWAGLAIDLPSATNCTYEFDNFVLRAPLTSASATATARATQSAP